MGSALLTTFYSLSPCPDTVSILQAFHDLASSWFICLLATVCPYTWGKKLKGSHSFQEFSHGPAAPWQCTCGKQKHWVEEVVHLVVGGKKRGIQQT